MRRVSVLFLIVVIILFVWSNFFHERQYETYEIHGEKIHTVQKGECINIIASKYNILPKQLRKANGMNKNQFLIYPKQELIIPMIEWKTSVGLASWYGPGFHGKKMANGQIYDQNKVSVAHKELPLNSKTEVVNLLNGLSIVVPVLDRGPYIEGRIVDLSYAAARALDMVKNGVVPVRITPLID